MYIIGVGWYDCVVTAMSISTYQIKMLIISISVTVLFYGIMTFGTDFNIVQNSFQAIGLYGAMVVFGLSLVNYCLRFVRWNFYIQLTHKNAVPVWRHFMIYLAGFALTTTPAKAGEAIRGVFLHPYGIPFQTSLACFFSERLSDLLAILILCLFGIADNRDYDTVLLIGCGLVIVLIGLICFPKIIMTIGNLFKSYPIFYNLFIKIYDILLQTKIYHHPVVLTKGVMLSVLSWGSEAVGFYYMIHILGFESVSLYEAVFIYAVSMFVGGISFIPGGLGSSEGVMIALLTSQNIPFAVATAMTLFTRIATLWFAVIIGFVCLAFVTRTDIYKQAQGGNV